MHVCQLVRIPALRRTDQNIATLPVGMNGYAIAQVDGRTSGQARF